MAGLVLTLKASAAAGERFDFSGLTPDVLAAGGPALASRVVGTTRAAARLGDAFAIRHGGSPADIVIETGGATIDGIGAKHKAGRLIVVGNAGSHAGVGMRGGKIEIRGDAGSHLGAGLSGGVIHVSGRAGDGAGALVAGGRFGMTGGTLVIDGDCGARAGDKMRRGLILVRGNAGPLAGSRMLGGTILVEGTLGGDAGRLMRRGTILAAKAQSLPATFADCGVHDLVILKVMARAYAAELGDLAPKFLPSVVRRYAGDLATIGRGELLLPA